MKALTSALRMADFDVITASTGVAPSSRRTTCGRALIIMDIVMPALDGIDARGFSRRLGRRAIPVFAHTGRPEECRAHEPALFAYVLAKPIEPDALVPLGSHFVGPRMLD